MSDKQRDEILRACLAALDAGLTPEETLAVWPEQRDEIEPLLRQALLLRVLAARRERRCQHFDERFPLRI